jgi:hypothetical protein
MNEQELRSMIRDSIARHLPSGVSQADAHPAYLAHAAFVRLPLVRGGDDDGACLIEPTVRCNHCGYCQSFGH